MTPRPKKTPLSGSQFTRLQFTSDGYNWDQAEVRW